MFGELMYLLEYRDKAIKLAGSDELFSIPENVQIIGTMNTADRAIALVDHALRRCFAFIKIEPNFEILRQHHQEKNKFDINKLIEILKKLNKVINDPHYLLGISYFKIDNLDDELEDILILEIEPYLEEYFFNDLDKIKDFRWSKIKTEFIPKS